MDILKRLEQLEADVALLKARLDPDAALLQSILPAIAAVVGNMTFTIGDLDDEVFAGMSRPKVGKLLARSVGKIAGGFRLDYIGVSRGMGRWRVTPIHSLGLSVHNAPHSTKEHK